MTALLFAVALSIAPSPAGNVVLSATNLVAGRRYTLETSRDLVLWFHVMDLNYAGGVTNFWWPDVPNAEPKQFYRMKESP